MRQTTFMGTRTGQKALERSTDLCIIEFVASYRHKDLTVADSPLGGICWHLLFLMETHGNP